MSGYETVIGLEIHVQLKTESKMFCGCDNFSADSEPNTNVCPVCLGMPGMLPVANKKAIEMTCYLGLALGGKISEKFNFERKNYFYPDLPKAYQITSSTQPPVVGGSVEVDVEGESSIIRIHHIHLEEDAGKLVHPNDSDYSLVDLNRAGTPLMEIVTEPDFRSPKEASVFMQDLRSIIRYLGISDANMEQGNMRCDANISIRKRGEKEYGTKVEIKNMNSFRMVERALEYEVKRQSGMLESNERIIQETRGWDDFKGVTVGQRSKEEANDYRYFPEPDLPPVDLAGKDFAEIIKGLKNRLPELPKQKRIRFEKEYGLNVADAKQLATDLELSSYFEKAIESLPEEIGNSDDSLRKIANKVSHWVAGDLIGKMNKFSVQISDLKITPQHIASLVTFIEAGKISGKQAKEVFDVMFETGEGPEVIIEKLDMGQNSNQEELSAIVEKVIANNPKSIEDFSQGKKQALGYLVGQVMAETRGQANPQMVNEILKSKLER